MLTVCNQQRTGVSGGKSRKKLTSPRGETQVGGIRHTLPLSFPFQSMTDDTQILGHCPSCDERISKVWLLLEYEKEDDSKGVWAECPACEEVVAPE